MAELQQEIRVVLETHGQLDATTIARLVNAHPLTVNRTCMNLVRAGHIQLVSGGNYELTQLGKQQLGTDGNPKRRGESEG